MKTGSKLAKILSLCCGEYYLFTNGKLTTSINMPFNQHIHFKHLKSIVKNPSKQLILKFMEVRRN